jgi:hypothetical protein
MHCTYRHSDNNLLEWCSRSAIEDGKAGLQIEREEDFISGRCQQRVAPIGTRTYQSWAKLN